MTERLSLCMVVKNEEHNLGRCLASVRHLVQEMVVVDTGSSDRTKEIALDYGAKVYHFPWQNDFSAARNFSLTQAAGDWVLFLDADEYMEQPPGEVQALLEKDIQGYFIKVISYLGETQGNEYVATTALRMFRNHPGYRFCGKIHEQILASIQELHPNAELAVAPLVIHHLGYLNKEIQDKHKIQRNKKLIKAALKDNPDDQFMRYNLATEHFRSGEYIKAVSMFEQVLNELDPGLSYAHLGYKKLITSYYVAGNYSKALDISRKALDLYPDYTDIWYLKGISLIKMDDYVAASSCFRKCLDLGPAAVNYHGESGAGDVKAARKLDHCLETLLRSKPPQEREAEEYLRGFLAAPFILC